MPIQKYSKLATNITIAGIFIPAFSTAKFHLSQAFALD
jgi:hypothetical protein